MPLFASQQTSNALGLPHSSLEETLRAFHVPFGTPEDLAAFPRRLARDEPLQDALAGLIRARQQSSPHGADAAANRLSLHQALDSLLHVVGGAPAPDLTANPTLHETVDLLISFLISLEGWSSAEMRAAVAPAAETSPASVGQVEGVAGTEQNRAEQIGTEQKETEQDVEERRSPEQIAQEQADDEELARLLRENSAASADGFAGSGSGSGLGGVGGTPVAGAAPLGDLTQLLTRLELTNLELRLQLESIDSRLNRMEPRIESLPRLQPEAGGDRAPEAPAPVPRHASDKPRYTTAAAFSAIPLGPEPSPFAGEAGAGAGEDRSVNREAKSGAGEAGAVNREDKTVATPTPEPAPRSVVLRFAAATSQSSEASDLAATENVVRDDLAPKSDDVEAKGAPVFSALAEGGALLSAPEAMSMLEHPPESATEAAAASALTAAPVGPDPPMDLGAGRDVDLASAPAAARSAPPPLPTSTLASAVSASPRLPVREARFSPVGRPGKRSRMTSLQLNDSPSEETGELPRVDAQAERSSVSDLEPAPDADDSTAISDRRRRWRAILIVLFLLLLAAGALAAFLFLGNPETTTFRGAVDQARSGSVSS